MRSIPWSIPRLTLWQRRLLVGLVTALCSQLYLSVWAEGFRVSAAAILYPILLVTLMRDSHRPDTGLATGLCVITLRTLTDLVTGMSLLDALVMEYPGGVFYLCYDALLCLLIKDRRSASLPRLTLSFWVCDLVSNTLNLFLSSHLRLDVNPKDTLILLTWLALARAGSSAAILWGGRSYRRLLLREEHEQRYRRLFLMTADLKTELYFLKKDAEDIEGIMTHAYQLYEKLQDQSVPEELTELALSIARDVHEVKKDNRRIIRGLEEEVAEVYDHESMTLPDLLNILQVSTRQFLGERRAEIRLECQCRETLAIREHYRLLSVLKNLVTNAVEAIQANSGRGTVRVDVIREGNQLIVTVTDDGPGITPRAMKVLFKVGYSTKFDPATGDINRGVGLPAVQFIVEELGGTIQVDSQPGAGATFRVALPLDQITGGNT